MATAKEVAALRAHVANLEHNLAHAERRLREAGVHATRLREPRPAHAPESTPSYRFAEHVELTKDDDHSA